MVPFSLLSARNTRGFFSDIYCRNLVEFLEVNLTILCPNPTSPPWLGPLVFLMFRLVHNEPLTICQLHFRFSYSSTGSYATISACDLCSGKSRHSAFACLLILQSVQLNVFFWWSGNFQLLTYGMKTVSLLITFFK